MDKIIIGIDPGKKGGIAWYNSAKHKYDCVIMPETVLDIYCQFADLKKESEELGCEIHCYIEDVGRGMPGQSSVSTANFGRHMGRLEMALTATKIPFTFVTPQKWMKALSLGNSKDYATHKDWKNHLKQRAQMEFPDIKITLWNADALLITNYGRKTYK